MTRIGMFFGIVALLVGCTANRFPDPYAGFEHSAQEQGYWKEVTTDEEKINELHLHSKGISITYTPFETYKDYWGKYSLTDERHQIHVKIEGGNKLPGFEEATGRFVEIQSDEIRITGIRMDSRRPNKTDFRLERFRIKNTQDEDADAEKRSSISEPPHPDERLWQCVSNASTRWRKNQAI